jgi:hypothetical protein
MEASMDKEFKARCLFMMAKCVQKQSSSPQYEEYMSNWDNYELAQKKYQSDFMNNNYFPQLQSLYRNTNFYKQQLTRCSYLKDFEGKNK